MRFWHVTNGEGDITVEYVIIAPDADTAKRHASEVETDTHLRWPDADAWVAEEVFVDTTAQATALFRCERSNWLD